MDNAKFLVAGNVKNTKSFKLHQERQRKAVEKYGGENMIGVGHSRAGLYLQELQKDPETKLGEIITYNKAVGFYDALRTNVDEQTDVKVKNDFVSLLSGLQKRKNKMVEIDATKNPLDFNKAHQAEEISKLGDTFIGKKEEEKLEGSGRAPSTKSLEELQKKLKTLEKQLINIEKGKTYKTTNKEKVSYEIDYTKKRIANYETNGEDLIITKKKKYKDELPAKAKPYKAKAVKPKKEESKPEPKKEEGKLDFLKLGENYTKMDFIIAINKYIRTNNLQSKTNEREFRIDKNLSKLFNIEENKIITYFQSTDLFRPTIKELFKEEPKPKKEPKEEDIKKEDFKDMWDYYTALWNIPNPNRPNKGRRRNYYDENFNNIINLGNVDTPRKTDYAGFEKITNKEALSDLLELKERMENRLKTGEYGKYYTLAEVKKLLEMIEKPIEEHTKYLNKKEEEPKPKPKAKAVKQQAFLLGYKEIKEEPKKEVKTESKKEINTTPKKLKPAELAKVFENIIMTKDAQAIQDLLRKMGASMIFKGEPWFLFSDEKEREKSFKRLKSKRKFNKEEFVNRFRRENCEEFMCEYGINSTKEFRKWLLKNHPDKGGTIDDADFKRAIECAQKDKYCKIEGGYFWESKEVKEEKKAKKIAAREAFEKEKQERSKARREALNSFAKKINEAGKAKKQKGDTAPKAEDDTQMAIEEETQAIEGGIFGFSAEEKARKQEYKDKKAAYAKEHKGSTADYVFSKSTRKKFDKEYYAKKNKAQQSETVPKAIESAQQGVEDDTQQGIEADDQQAVGSGFYYLKEIAEPTNPIFKYKHTYEIPTFIDPETEFLLLGGAFTDMAGMNCDKTTGQCFNPVWEKEKIKKQILSEYKIWYNPFKRAPPGTILMAWLPKMIEDRYKPLYDEFVARRNVNIGLPADASRDRFERQMFSNLTDGLSYVPIFNTVTSLGLTAASTLTDTKKEDGT